MDYFESESLFQIIFNPEIKAHYNFNEKNKNRIARQICSAIAFLHLQLTPIIHRDIKPCNILVNSNYEVKMCDFGFATCTNLQECLQSTCQANKALGTYLFMAPEILLKNEAATWSSDVWAFACTMIEMYGETLVWDVENYDNDYYHCTVVNLTKQNIPRMKNIPLFIRSKLVQCFNYIPERRPEMKDILSLYQNEKKMNRNC